MPPEDKAADERQMRVEGVAWKALLLDSGDSFCIPVSGGAAEAAAAEQSVRDALVREYELGQAIVQGLAEPGEIVMRSIVTPQGSHLLIERVAAGPESCS
jgi:hypothetical protein